MPDNGATDNKGKGRYRSLAFLRDLRSLGILNFTLWFSILHFSRHVDFFRHVRHTLPESKIPDDSDNLNKLWNIEFHALLVHESQYLLHTTDIPDKQTQISNLPFFISLHKQYF